MKAHPLYVGKRVSVFDPKLWDKNGGDSKKDSFRRPAIVLEIWGDTATVKFEHDGRISKGHFISGFEEILKFTKNT